MYDRMQLQVIADERHKKRQEDIQYVSKKILKKAKLSKSKEDMILNLTLSELQLKLLEQLISSDNPLEENLEVLTIEDVILVYLKQIIENAKYNIFGEQNFKLTLEQSKWLNKCIQEMIQFAREIEQKSKGIIQNMQQNESVKQTQISQSNQNQIQFDIQEEEEKQEEVKIEEEDVAPQSLMTVREVDDVKELKQKSPFQQILNEKSLLGLIVAVSDFIQVKGFQSNYGVVQSSFYQNTDDSLLSEYLQKQGALILLKSNISQGCIPMMDAHNKLWNQSVNPWDQIRICGSSTEASLIATKQVNFAISVDFLGEQKVNCMFNGVNCFSPSPSRFPIESINKNQQQVRSKVTGFQNSFIQERVCFISKKTEDIRQVLDVLFQDNYLNKVYDQSPHVLRIPLNNDIYYGERPLKLLYLDTQSFIDTCPSIKRAILTSYGHLASLGYQLEKIQGDLPHFDEIFKIIMRLQMNLSFKQNKIVKQCEQNDQFIYLKELLNGTYRFGRKMIKLKIGQAHKSYFELKNCFIEYKLASELQADLSKLEELKQEAQAFLKQRYNADLILCPVYPTVAPHIDDFGFDYIRGYAYSTYWNALDMPSGVITQTLVNNDETDYKDHQRNLFEMSYQKSMKNSSGLPISIQLVGNKNQDEVVLRVMRELQDKSKFKLPNKFD
ncbi:UNKNOWN [Stylonychia lemnae]|uniref:Amidase domain-containing protein n=1 Tax=Stylonychia lemnae TaxID=5949 RepID=A0A078B218_STYLE|nr:UNKNOWN [Stylonychia lemnae]|eukprot:CDW87403.1 UNKNOWN [Stylonychia lemnae]